MTETAPKFVLPTASISLDSRWNRVPGLMVNRGEVTIDPAIYFFRYEEPAWHIIDWNEVQAAWNDLKEDDEVALEQLCLDFIRKKVRLTNNPAEVLENAAKVYNFLFSEERLADPDLDFVTTKHLQALRETSTLMALNRVARDGRARNVGPAWFFPVCSQVVFDLTDQETEEVDELYHGGFFNETRRIDGIKANTALGGRIVHGCQSVRGMKGGAVVAYGTDIEGFRRDLASFADNWTDIIRTWSVKTS